MLFSFAEIVHMKKQNALILLLSLLSSFSFAQEKFQGAITFKTDVTGEGAEMAKSFLPDSYEYLVGKNALVFKMNGGLAQSMTGDILLSGKTGETHMVKHSEKTVYKLKPDKNQPAPVKKVEATDETLSILGYECKKYKVTMEAGGQSATQYVWATERFKIAFSFKGNQDAGGILIPGISGMPLKIMSTVMGYTIVMTASEISQKKLPKSTFILPKGYEVKEFEGISSFGF